MIFSWKWSKTYFSHKYWHFLFQICNQYALGNFLRALHVCRSKIGDVENSFHIHQIFESPQPRGCSWRGYATQEADQELKWKLRTLYVWEICVLEFLGPQRTFYFLKYFSIFECSLLCLFTKYNSLLWAIACKPVRQAPAAAKLP